MANYVQYSPWQDAAEVGKGIGDALGTILFRLPVLKAEERRRNRELDIQERHYGAIEKHYEAEEGNASLGLELRRLGLTIKQQQQQAQFEQTSRRIAEMERHNIASEGLRTAENDRRQSFDDRRIPIMEKNSEYAAENVKTARAKYLDDRMGEGPKLPPLGEVIKDEPQTNNVPPPKPGMGARIGSAVSAGMQGLGSLVTKAQEVLSTTQQQQQKEPYKFQLTPYAQSHTEGYESLLAPDVMQQLQGMDSNPDTNMFQSTDEPAAGSPGSKTVGVDAPPKWAPNHRVLIRNDSTGDLFWTDEVGANRQGYTVIKKAK